MPYLAVAFLTLLLVIPAEPVAAQVQPEVYASGMRNPYRWSFDRQTNDMYIGDVGGTNEEITFVPAAQSRGRKPGLELLLGHGQGIELHPLQLLPALVPVPELGRTL